MSNSTKKWALISLLSVVCILLVVAIGYQFKRKSPNEIVKTPVIKEENTVEPVSEEITEPSNENINESQSDKKEIIIDIEPSTEEQTETQTQTESKVENTEIHIETQVPQQTTPKHVETQVSTELLTEEQGKVPTEVETEKQAEISTELQTEKQIEKQTEAPVQTEAVLKEIQQSTTKSKQDNNSPKHGDTNDKGQIYVDGFGWIDNQGENKESKADDMYENGNKIGIME